MGLTSHFLSSGSLSFLPHGAHSASELWFSLLQTHPFGVTPVSYPWERRSLEEFECKIVSPYLVTEDDCKSGREGMRLPWDQMRRFRAGGKVLAWGAAKSRSGELGSHCLCCGILHPPCSDTPLPPAACLAKNASLCVSRTCKGFASLTTFSWALLG